MQKNVKNFRRMLAMVLVFSLALSAFNGTAPINAAEDTIGATGEMAVSGEESPGTEEEIAPSQGEETPSDDETPTNDDETDENTPPDESQNDENGGGDAEEPTDTDGTDGSADEENGNTEATDEDNSAGDDTADETRHGRQNDQSTGPGDAYAAGKLLIVFHDPEELLGSGLMSTFSERSVARAFNSFSGEIAAVSELGGGIQTVAVVDLPANMSVEAAITEYEKSPLLKYAQPLYIYQMMADVPNDTILNKKWLKTNDPWPSHHIPLKTFAAWESVGLGDAPVRVAVIDSQIDLGHEDLQDALRVDMAQNIQFRNDRPTRLPLDPADSHGTHVAGLMGATANNNAGDVGVAAGRVEIIPINVFEWMEAAQEYGGAWEICVAEGIYYAVEQEARIINLSLGGDTEDRFMRDAIDHAVNAGVVVIVSAGNNTFDNPTYPSDYENVVSVINVSHNEFWHEYNDGVGNWMPYDPIPWELGENPRHYTSSYGPKKNISAPGNLVWGPVPVGEEMESDEFPGYDLLNGTSMASPVTVGVAALMLYADPDLNPLQVATTLFETATDVHTPGKDDQTGHGVVNALAAVEILSLERATGLEATKAGQSFTSVDLSWRMETGNPSHFEVARMLDGNVELEAIRRFAIEDVLAGGPGTFAYQWNDLSFNDYRFAVRPIFDGGENPAVWIFSDAVRLEDPGIARPETVTLNVKAHEKNPLAIELSFPVPQFVEGGSTITPLRYEILRTDNLNVNAQVFSIAASSAPSYIDHATIAGRTYNYSVRPIWPDIGPGTLSAVKSHKLNMPAAPRLSGRGNYSPTKIELTWSEVASAAGYEIRLEGMDDYTILASEGRIKEITEDLSPNTAYHAMIRPFWQTDAENADTISHGNFGPAITVRTQPGPAPTDLRLEGAATVTSATLQWEPPANAEDLGVVGYRINKNGVPAAYISAGDFRTAGNKWTDTRLGPGTTVRYSVQACWGDEEEDGGINEYGSKPGNASKVLTVSSEKGEAPRILTTMGASCPTTIDISWLPLEEKTVGVTRLSGYRIYAGNVPMSTEPAVWDNPAAEETSITYLSPNTQYPIRVVPLWDVEGDIVEGRPSAAVNRKTKAAPKPATPWTTVRTGGQVVLSWGEPPICDDCAALGSGGCEIVRYRVTKGRAKPEDAYFETYKNNGYTYRDPGYTQDGLWSDVHPGMKTRYTVQAVYRVEGLDGRDHRLGSGFGPISTALNVTTPNPAPKLREAEAERTMFRTELFWNPIAGVAEYEVYANGSPVGIVSNGGGITVQAKPPIPLKESGGETQDLGAIRLLADKPGSSLSDDEVVAVRVSLPPGSNTKFTVRALYRAPRYRDEKIYLGKASNTLTVKTAGGGVPSGLKRHGGPDAKAASPTSLPTVGWNAMNADIEHLVSDMYYIRLTWKNAAGQTVPTVFPINNAAGVTTYDIGGLIPDTTYTVQIAAAYEDDTQERRGAWSKAIKLKTTGGAPRNLKASDIGLTSATLTWGSPSNAMEPDSYHISWQDSDGTGGAVSFVEEREYTDTDLKPGITRRYQVRAHWPGGSGTGKGANRAVSPKGAAPGGVRATASPNSINVTWNAITGAHALDAGASLTHYRVERRQHYSWGWGAWMGENILATDASTDRSHNFSAVPNNRYQVRVAGVWNDTLRGRYSPAWTLRTSGPAPKNLRAHVLGTDSSQAGSERKFAHVHLTWDPVLNQGVNEYRVVRSRADGTHDYTFYVSLWQYYGAQSPGLRNGFIDTIALPGTSYRYDVMARFGWSEGRAASTRVKIPNRF